MKLYITRVFDGAQSHHKEIEAKADRDKALLKENR